MNLPNNHELLNSFTSFLSESGLSAVSIKNYLSDIRHYFRFLDSIHGNNLTQVFQNPSKYINKYIDEQKSLLTPLTTTNRRLASIRRFATFLKIKFQIISSENLPESYQNASSGNNTQSASNNNSLIDDKNISSKKILDQFRQQLINEKKTHSTVKNYLSDLYHYFSWIANQTPYNTHHLAQILSIEQLQNYISYQKLTHTSTSVINRRQSSIKKLTHYCFAQGFIPTDPFEVVVHNIKIAPLSWLTRFISKPKSPQNASKSRLAIAYNKYNSLPFTPYLHLALLVLATTTMAILGYNQIIKQARPSSAATALTPPRRQLSFQGRLTDSAGTPISTAVNLNFKLWDQVSGGTETTCDGSGGQNCLYKTGTCSITPDQDGIFNSLIGDGVCGTEIPQSVFTDHRDLYLAVTVGAETLTPRQQIATVGYALNSETLQGYPASSAATINTVPVVDNSGNITIGASSPSIVSTSGNFNIKGQSLSLTTALNSGGDIVIQPDALGSGQILALGGTTTEDSFRITNANLTTGSLLSAYIGNDTATTSGRLLTLTSGATETERFSIRADGSTAINTATNSAGLSAFIINQGNSGANILSASSSGVTKFTINNAGGISFLDGVAHTIDDISGDLTLTSNSSTISLNDNVTFAGTTTLNGQAYTWPASQTNTYVLSTNGAGTLSWVAQTGGVGTNYWNQASGALYPLNSTVDFLLGGQATSSAKFAVLNMFSGTPTASISGTTTNVATFIDGNGNISSTNRNNLTLGNSATYNSTGNILLNPNGTGYVGIGTTGPTQGLEVGSTALGLNTQVNATHGADLFTSFLRTNWTLGAGWDATNNGDTSLNKNANGTSNASLNTVAAVIGTTYKVVINVDAMSVAGATYTWGGMSGTALTTTGTYTDYITAITTAGLIITPSPTGSRLDINSISIIPLTDNTGDIYAKGDIYMGSSMRTMTGVSAFSLDPNGAVRMPKIAGAVTTTGALTIAGALSGVTAMTNSSTITSSIATLFVPTVGLSENAAAASTGTTAALIPIQYSPAIRSLGYAWNTTGTPASNFYSQRHWIEPYVKVSGSGFIDGRQKWELLSDGVTISERNNIELMSLGRTGGTDELNVLGQVFGPEVLNNPNLTAGTSWTAAGGVSLTADAATYSHNVAQGSLTQTSANLATALKPNRWYRFTYTTSASTITVRAYIDETTTSAERIYLPGVTPAAGVGAQQITFKTNSSPTDFKIQFTSAVGAITFDTLSLQEVQSGNIVANGQFTGGGTSGIKIDQAGNVGIGTTAPSATLSVGANLFQVAGATGNATVQAGYGLDVIAAGALNLGNVTATTIGIGGTAATTVNIASGGTLDRTINIGVGNSIDTINIGTGATGADVINIGSANAGAVSLKGGANSLIDFPNFDVATTGDITVANQGDLRLSEGSGGGTNYTGFQAPATLAGDVIYTLPTADAASSGYVLSSNASGTLSWVAQTGGGTSYWDQASGALYPLNSTVDFLLGGQATSSAKFAVLNMFSGTPTASISGTTTNVATFIDGNGNISSTNRNNLTLGNSATYNSTGNILLNPNGTGYVGIGTSNPSTIVQIGDGTNAAIQTFTDGSGSLQTTIDYQTTGASAPSSAAGWKERLWGSGTYEGTDYGIGINTNTLWFNTGGTDISFFDSGTQVATIQNGNLGIGTTAPSATLSVGANLFLVDGATGNATLQAGYGLDTIAAGALNLGNVTATTIGIGGTAATTVNIASGGTLNRTINIGVGNSIDTINIGTGATGADVINIGSANAGNVTIKSNAVLNLTGSTNSLIDFPNFDVATTGNITVAAGNGLDTNAAGELALGNTTATTVGIGGTAATTLNIGAGGNLTRAINLGTGTGVDTINIGTGATGADVINIGSANAGNVTIKSNAVLNLTGSTNSLIDFPNFDVATTGDITVANQGDLRLSEGSGGGTNYTGFQAPATLAGDVIYTLPTADAASSGYVLSSNASGTLSWVAQTATPTQYWSENSGTLFANNSTSDFLLGGQATSSAKFAVLNMFSGTPTASISGTTTNVATFIDGNGNISSTNRNNLTLGNSATYNSTGNILLNPNGTGYVGIGTTAPSQLLEITGNSRVNGIVYLSGTSYNVSNGTSWLNILRLGGARLAGSGGLTFEQTLGSPSMKIDGSGNVGIGTTLPSATLSVGANLFQVAGATGNATVQAGYGLDTIAAGTLALGDTTATTVNIATSGTLDRIINIGVGNSIDTINIGTGATGADVIAIGGGTGTLAINTSNWDISTLGVASSFTGFASSGTINFSGLSASSAVYTDGSSNLTSVSPTTGTLGFWQRSSGSVSPWFISDAINLGNVATSSALVHLTGTGGTDNSFFMDPVAIGFNTAMTNMGTGPGFTMLQVDGDILPKITDEDNLGSGANAWQNVFISQGISDTTAEKINIASSQLKGTQWNVTGNLRVGDTVTPNAGGIEFYVAGDTQMTGTLNVGGAVSFTGSVSVGASFTVGGGTGKIDVGTVDPPYTINGEKYATYMAGMVGVKEEVTGNLVTSEYIEGLGYRKVINFNSQEKGSDLWLFGKTTNIKQNLSRLSVLLSPQTQTSTWYELDENTNTLYIYSSTPTNISFRLTAPRFDNTTWANTRSSGPDGFVLNDPDNATQNNNIAYVNYSSQIANIDGVYKLITNNVEKKDTLNLSKSLIANLKAGIAVVNELVADNLTVNNKLISPLADIGKLTVNDATVSGNLYADNIKSKTIDKLSEQLDILGDKYSTASAILANLQEKYTNYDSLFGQVNSGTSSANIDPLTLSPLATTSAYLPSDLSLNSLNVQTLISNDILANGSIFSQALNSFDTDLFIQSSGEKPVHILANLMTLYPNGQVAINGDLIVTGNLFANNIDTRTATVSGTLAVGKGELATDSASILALFNNNGDVVGSVDASGSAKFGELSTNGLIIASGINKDASISGQTASNSTVGTASIATGSAEIVIANNKVTADTLIYITPVSDTSNQVLYVKSKQVGTGFTVAVPQPVEKETAFNFWLVQTK